MKHIFILIAVFVLSLLFTNCTDLEILPEDAFTEEAVFTDLEAYRSYLAKVYGSYSLTGQDGPHGDGDISIVNDEGFTSYIRAYWKAQELTTEEAVIAWTDAGLRDLHSHSWSSENQFVRVLYYRIALIVSYANDFLTQSEPEKLDKNGITEADRSTIDLYRAETRVMRALAYWHALDLFRNVAVITEITATPPNQSTPEELFNFILTELNEAETILPDPRQNEYGRVDKAMVWMLKAKLFLNAEHMIGTSYYDETIQECEKLLNAGYALDNDYQHLFLADNHTSNEIIFALNSDGKNTKNWGCTTFLVRAVIGGDMDASLSGVASGWAGMRTTENLVNRFPDMDGQIDQRAIFFTDGQRLEIENIGEFTDGIAVPKYKNVDRTGVSGSDVDHADTDYPMFRLGDVHLMFAEATLRGASNGDMSKSLTLINELRSRAYGNSTGHIIESQMTLDFILDERSRELYFEGHRRLDLVRFGQFTDKGVWPWKGDVMQGRTTESFRDIFPLPASDLLANPNLIQNEGY